MTRDSIRQAVAPAYLLLCLVLGGSVQGVWANMLLQLVAIAIICWAVLDRHAALVPQAARRLGAIIAIALLLVALQLVPLPPVLWTALPGRTMVVDGYAILGLAPGWRPVSLSPHDSLMTVATLLSPLAVLTAIVRFGARSTWIALAVVGATVLAVLLGALQVTGEASASSPWYFYPHSNFGTATGFFANSNHMATLLLVAIPFAAALGSTAQAWSDDPRKRSAAMAVVAGALIVILIGLALNRSLAGLGLALPVVIASLLLIGRPRRAWVRSAAIAIGLASFVSFVLLVASPLNERFIAQGAATSVSTRAEMLDKGSAAWRDFAPVGSGLGTFEAVYRGYEDPAAVDPTFVNHAHNDYLEIGIEMGLPGILLLLLFLAWWGKAAWNVGKSPAFDQYAAAGAISSAAILIHSAVDFPLRTAAGSALFAAGLALMIVSVRKIGSTTDLRPARHLVID